MKLKTLKDIDWKELGHGDSVDIVENDTLRHFKIALYPSTYRKKLKQEAIKHIKELELNPDQYPSVKWIKHFFNITEDDLK